MVRSRQRKLVAVVIGVVLAAAPVAGFNMWLIGVIDARGADEVDSSVRRAVAVIDARLERAAATLNELAAQGVDSCSPANLDKLRQAAFSTSPVKELSIVGPDGQTACTDLGLPLGRRHVLSAQRAASDDVVVEVVRLDDRDTNFLRVRRIGAGGRGLAALVPADMLIPQTSTQGGALSADACVRTADGLLIGEGGVPLPPGTASDELATSTMRSEKFGLTVTISLPKSAVDVADLRRIGLVVNGLMAIAILSLGALGLRRFRGDPIAEIERAIEADEFVPFYQPIIDITSGKLRGAEVLARWRRPDGILVLPAAFVPLVEQSGLIVKLTRSLMRNACAEVGDAFAARPELRIGFNLTAQHFTNDVIVDDVREIFAGSPIRLDQLVLELTERQPLESLTTTRRVIAALQRLGCRVALDDVGIGHSGLSSILNLGVDIIKIDKMFIDSLGSERNAATIVGTMVELARNMRMDVIAEGVETFEQVADLRARGIRAAQGYVFAPPLPGSSFLRLLEALVPAQAAKAAGPAAGAHGRAA